MSRLRSAMGAFFLAPAPARSAPPPGGWAPPVDPAPGRHPAGDDDARSDEGVEAGCRAAWPDSQSGPAGSARSRAPLACVLGAAGDAVATACAVAGELRARRRASAGLVLAWQPGAEPPRGAPAWPPARSLAQREAGAGAVAVARGRIAVATLPSEAAGAAAAAHDAIRRAAVPVVVAVAGPRPVAFDDLLARADVLVVVASTGLVAPLAELAAADLRALNENVAVAAPVAGHLRRRLALAGSCRARDLGAPLDSCAA